MSDLINPNDLKQKIFIIRNQKVMIDSDLAELYGVQTKRLNESVKRNITRFPSHFMFQLTQQEWETLRSQFATSNESLVNRGGRQYLPYAFTEQGVAMLSSVLHSEKAIQINIQIMDTFVKLRQFALENKELAQRLNQLEQYFIKHSKDVNSNFEEIYRTLDLLIDRTKPSTIGFVTDEEK